MSKDAKPDRWMPLFIGDYKKDTGRLTRDQHGGYLLLIMEYWNTGPLPDDDGELAAIALASRREWAALRPKLVRFFRVEDGCWRHKRIDEELERWSERKRIFAERAAAGGRAKAAKSSASSTPQAVLNGCTQSPSREVRAPSGALTLSGDRNSFSGPKEVRDAFAQQLGEDWVRAYVDPCGWQDVPDRALIPATGVGGQRLIREGRTTLKSLGLIVLEKVA